MGIRVVTHAIVKFGTDEQKCYFLPRILTGEVFFCQGYSDHVRPDRGVPPGIEIRPLVMTSGEKVQNQVFFDEVRVPKANVLGDIDDGWTVAASTNPRDVSRRSHRGLAARHLARIR
jgi:alkylation response protein AidB-like acyl-CoA dehydrogenase